MNCHGRKATFLYRDGPMRVWRCLVTHHDLYMVDGEPVRGKKEAAR